MLQWVGGWFSGWRPQDATLVRNWDLQRFRTGSCLRSQARSQESVLFFILSVMFVCCWCRPQTLAQRLAPPADTWSLVAVELRLLERRGGVCAQRFGDFIDVVWKVVDNCFFVSGVRDSCATRFELQLQREKRMIHSAIVRAWPGNSPCCTRAQRMRLPSSFVSCSHKKQDADLIAGRIRLVRTTMRKEAVLDGDAIARTFEVVLKKVFTSVETLVGTNSSNFAKRFLHD